MNINFYKSWFLEWRSYLAEFLGTFLFVIICQIATLISYLYGDITRVEVALTIGFSYIALLFVTTHLSEGFLNPVITVSLWLSQKLSTTKFIFYLTAQILASFCASVLILLMFGKDASGFNMGLPILGINVDLQTALIFEAIFSAGLVLVVFATMIDRRGPVSFGPFAVGLYLTSVTILLTTISGGVLNPARIIGAAVFSRSYDLLAVFVIGPLIGSLLGILYDFIFLKKPRKKSS